MDPSYTTSKYWPTILKQREYFKAKSRHPFPLFRAMAFKLHGENFPEGWEDMVLPDFTPEVENRYYGLYVYNELNPDLENELSRLFRVLMNIMVVEAMFPDHFPVLISTIPLPLKLSYEAFILDKVFRPAFGKAQDTQIMNFLWGFKDD